MSKTYELIKIIGSPFIDKTPEVDQETLTRVYGQAFADRVALLYLTIHRNGKNWNQYLEKKFKVLSLRRENTLRVIGDLGAILNRYGINDYAVFKSLKPYPSTPNDTDIIIFGDRDKFDGALDTLYEENYQFHEWAPMQTTLIHPDGIGKTGKGKKGGTWYVDMYSDISTDYFLYIDKRSLEPYVETRMVEGRPVKNVKKEIELAIILFHNVFPERTFQLEHFYMPLYHLAEEDFDIDIMLKFVSDQKLTRALSTNLTLVAHIHNEIFGFVPDAIETILERIGQNRPELERFIQNKETTPYMLSPKTFWLTFLDKIYDPAAFKSLMSQGLHMLNPIFFFDVMRSLYNRFSERGTYHLE